MRRSSRTTNDDLLSGWKEIANYLHCSTKTAQRWEESDELPTIRPEKTTSLKGPVFASRRALDLWLKGSIGKVVLTDDQLIAFGRGSKPLWARQFPSRLRGYSPEELAWRLQIVDLPGSGDKGVLVAVQLDSAKEAENLTYFTAEGKLVWSVDISPDLKKAGEVLFENAWTIKHLVVVPERSGHTIWAALANNAGWGGCVLRFDAHGRSDLRFANAGFVEHLGLVALAGERCLVLCGENNDFDLAFVALLGIDDAPSCSIPGKRTVYRFANAPDARPRKYILFPRSELIVARQKPYGHTTGLHLYQDRLVVHVETGGEGASFLYHFAPDLEPMYAFPSGSHEFAHQALEHDGALDHPWTQCPERKSPLSLRIWKGVTGWRTSKIPWRDDPWKDD
jgi:hypothetical protein